jgi:hypothetical protein
VMVGMVILTGIELEPESIERGSCIIELMTRLIHLSGQCA